jgi:hypothetical protein
LDLAGGESGEGHQLSPTVSQRVVSVGGGFMMAMAAAPTDTATAISGAVAPRRRGKSTAPNFTYDGPVSVIGLELDVSDAGVRRRLQRQWAAVFRLRRAL